MDPLSSNQCGNCAATLAHDQRYCLACGHRRGALASPAAQAVGAMLERGRSISMPVAPRVINVPGSRLSLALPSPRAAAVGVLAMLGFGVVIGSFAPRSVGDLASAPILLVVKPVQHAVQSAATDAGTGADGGGAQTQVAQTITQTIGGGGTGSAGGGSFTSVATSTTSSTSSSSSTTNILGLPPIKHVFLIVLSGQGYNQTFSPTSGDTYLSKTLPHQGALLADYYAVAPSSLANGIALLAGQGPNPDTAAECPRYTPFAPATKAANGQFLGQGCVFPKTVPTVLDQLATKGQTWSAYIQGIDQGPKSDTRTCRHATLGQVDPYATPRPTDPYVSSRNPPAYFAGLTSTDSCSANDVGDGQLGTDLKLAGTTPALSYIVPDACHDGSDQPCAPGAPAGLAPADTFLAATIKKIEASPAYKADGLIAVTFDHAPQTGPHADPSACCSTPTYPNLPAASTASSTGTASSPTSSTATTSTFLNLTSTSTSTSTSPSTSTTTSTTDSGGGQTTATGGGGQVGLVLISRYIKPGTTDVVNYYNHYSLLASIENIFGLKKLGYAGQLGLPVLDAGVFNHP